MHVYRVTLWRHFFPNDVDISKKHSILKKLNILPHILIIYEALSLQKNTVILKFIIQNLSIHNFLRQSFPLIDGRLKARLIEIRRLHEGRAHFNLNEEMINYTRIPNSMPRTSTMNWSNL